MTCLTIIQNAAGRMNLDQPSAVFSSTDDQVVQFRTLLNQEGKELANRGDWEVLKSEKTFTTTAAAVQAGAIPTDLGHIINRTMYDRTERKKIVGPITDQKWQQIQAGVVTSILYRAFRFRGGEFLLTPTPPAGNTIAYEYISKNWCEAAGGAAQSAFAADTDIPLLDEELLTKGLIWRFKQAKGLSYAEDFATYEVEVGKALGRDGGAAVINLSSGGDDVISALSIEDGNWTV